MDEIASKLPWAGIIGKGGPGSTDQIPKNAAASAADAPCKDRTSKKPGGSSSGKGSRSYIKAAWHTRMTRSATWRGLNPRSRSVFMYLWGLCQGVNETDAGLVLHCRAKRDTIARAEDCDISTVQRALDKLREAKLIETHSTKGRFLSFTLFIPAELMHDDQGGRQQHTESASAQTPPSADAPPAIAPVRQQAVHPCATSRFKNAPSTEQDRFVHDPLKMTNNNNTPAADAGADAGVVAVRRLLTGYGIQARSVLDELCKLLHNNEDNARAAIAHVDAMTSVNNKPGMLISILRTEGGATEAMLTSYRANTIKQHKQQQLIDRIWAQINQAELADLQKALEEHGLIEYGDTTVRTFDELVQIIREQISTEDQQAAQRTLAKIMGRIENAESRRIDTEKRLAAEQDAVKNGQRAARYRELMQWCYDERDDRPEYAAEFDTMHTLWWQSTGHTDHRRISVEAIVRDKPIADDVLFGTSDPNAKTADAWKLWTELHAAAQRKVKEHEERKQRAAERKRLTAAVGGVETEPTRPRPKAGAWT